MGHLHPSQRQWAISQDGVSEQELKASEKVQDISPEEGQSWEGSPGEGSSTAGQGKCLVTNELGVQQSRKQGWGCGVWAGVW